MFSEPILYQASQASGVMTLSDYSKNDMYQQKEAEFIQLGLTQDEVELKMVDCGLLSKVNNKKYNAYSQSHIQVIWLFILLRYYAVETK